MRKRKVADSQVGSEQYYDCWEVGQLELSDGQALVVADYLILRPEARVLVLPESARHIDVRV